MLERIVIFTLTCTGIYALFFQGMILGWLRISAANMLDKCFGKKVSRYIQKPLWDCLPCMSFLWICLITWSFDPLVILAVCGLNQMVESVILSGDE